MPDEAQQDQTRETRETGGRGGAGKAPPRLTLCRLAWVRWSARPLSRPTSHRLDPADEDRPEQVERRRSNEDDAVARVDRLPVDRVQGESVPGQQVDDLARDQGLPGSGSSGS